MISDKFLTWIKKQGGPRGLQRKFGVTTHTVRNWIRGDSHPEVNTARAIIVLSKGELSYVDLLGNPHNWNNSKQN